MRTNRTKKDYFLIKSGQQIININSSARPRSGLIAFIANPPRTNQFWIVSCYHVLCRLNTAFPRKTEMIHAVRDGRRKAHVADIHRLRLSKRFDCAAARICLPYGEATILRRKTHRPMMPRINMRVVRHVRDHRVFGRVAKIEPRILIVPSRPQDEAWCNRDGDSGSLWLDRDTNAPIAMRCTGSTKDAGNIVYGLAVTEVLKILRFSPKIRY